MLSPRMRRWKRLGGSRRASSVPAESRARKGGGAVVVTMTGVGCSEPRRGSGRWEVAAKRPQGLCRLRGRRNLRSAARRTWRGSEKSDEQRPSVVTGAAHTPFRRRTNQRQPGAGSDTPVLGKDQSEGFGCVIGPPSPIQKDTNTARHAPFISPPIRRETNNEARPLPSEPGKQN